MKELIDRYREKLVNLEIARQEVSDLANKSTQAGRNLEDAKVALRDSEKLLLQWIADNK